MSWRLAESLKQLRSQVNAAWPGRDKTSDGSIGDLSHSARKSDHNPNAAGVVCAIDIDADLSGAENVGVLVRQLQASKDPRIKYIIWNAQITVPGDVTQWKAYTGPNDHRHHAHISVVSDVAHYDDARSWDLSGTVPASTPVVPKIAQVLLKKGDIGPLVVKLQMALGIKADGDFGPATEAAVKAAQQAHGLPADGIVGDQTRKALGI